MISPSLRSHRVIGSAAQAAPNLSGAASLYFNSAAAAATSPHTVHQPSICRSTVPLLLLQRPLLQPGRRQRQRAACHRNFGTRVASSTGSRNYYPPIRTAGQWQCAQFSTSARTMADRYLRQTHDRVFESNRAWAAEQTARDPEFFKKLSEGQAPEYLWIGCSDSRIPAEQIAGLSAGEAFVHRNIANLVPNTDLNAMSVIQYAVAHLHVKHIVVCGHYGCGGVKAAMTAQDLGILNPWLRGIRDVYRLHERELDAITDEGRRYDRLVELNVVEQCRNVIKTAVVQRAFADNKFPVVHGWVFGFGDGLLKDLDIDFEAMLTDIQKIYNLTGN